MLQMATFLIFAFILSWQFTRDSTLQRHNVILYHDYNPSVILAIIWVFCCITGIIFFLDLNLVIFHYYIISKKMTTLEYVRMKRDEEIVRSELVISF